MTFRMSKNFSKCPMCGSMDISTKNNGAGRKEEEAGNVFIEPLTCNNCWAAVTRFYNIKSRVGNNVMKEHSLTTAITAD